MPSKFPKPDEVVLVGSKTASRRPLMKYLGLSAMTLAVVGGSLHAAGFNPTTLEEYQTAPETVSAQVVAKIWAPQGAVLPQQPTQNGQWQPHDDMTSSRHTLILFIPGEIEPVALAVSPEVYHSYCKHVDAADYKSIYRSKVNIARHEPCGTQYDLEGNTKVKINQLDTVNLTYTRAERNSAVRVQSFEGTSKHATSFLDRQALKRNSQPVEPGVAKISPRG